MPLVFDTTRPHSMIPNGEKVTMRDGAPLKGPTSDNSVVRPFHIPDGIHYSFYIHGQAEDDLGFDIPVIIEGEMPSVPGIYDCIINGKPSKLSLWIPEGREQVAVYRWDKEGNFIRKGYNRKMRGLAIYADDEESKLGTKSDERKD